MDSATGRCPHGGFRHEGIERSSAMDLSVPSMSTRGATNPFQGIFPFTGSIFVDPPILFAILLDHFILSTTKLRGNFVPVTI